MQVESTTGPTGLLPVDATCVRIKAHNMAAFPPQTSCIGTRSRPASERYSDLSDCLEDCEEPTVRHVVAVLWGDGDTVVGGDRVVEAGA